MASRHDKKRAERFEAAGIGEADLPYAATAYLGDSGGECRLCDTNIMYLYQLTFHRPAGAAVEMFPVGSQCIKDWMKAMPESVARSEAIAKVRAAEATMRKQRKLLKQLTEAGDEDAANLFRIYFRLPAEAVDGALSDIGVKVIRRGSFASDSQRRYFASLVRTAAREAGLDERQDRQTSAAPKQQQQDVPGADDAERELMCRWRALPEDARGEGAMGDIGAKVERFGSFASDKQHNYFKRLVTDAERDAGFAASPGGYVRVPSDRVHGGFRDDHPCRDGRSAAPATQDTSDGAPPPPDAPEPDQGPKVQGDLFGGVPTPTVDDELYTDPF